MDYYLGVDVGGTSTKIGIVDEKRTIVAMEEYSVDFDNYCTPILDTVVKAIHSFLENKSNYSIKAIGVCATGQVDVEKGIIIGTAGHIDNYLGTKFKETLEGQFNLPCTVINDADAVVLSEYFEQNMQVKNIISITVGTGIGGGVISDGQLLLGTDGIAAELGHVSIDYNGKQCYCGQKGCLEQYASTTALLSSYCQLKEIDECNGIEFFVKIRSQDKCALNVLNEWLSYIASGIANLTHTFNPELIVLSGGITAQADLFIDELEERAFQKIMPAFKKKLSIQVTRNRNNSGIIGAVDYYKIMKR